MELELKRIFLKRREKKNLQLRISWVEVKFFPANRLNGSDDIGISWDVVTCPPPPIVLSLESSFTDSDSLRSSEIPFRFMIYPVRLKSINLLFTSCPSFISVTAYEIERFSLLDEEKCILEKKLRTADDVIDDFENKRSASLNFLFRLSAFDIMLLLDAKYLSHPRIIFPYSWVSSKYEPSKA